VSGPRQFHTWRRLGERDASAAMPPSGAPSARSISCAAARDSERPAHARRPRAATSVRSPSGRRSPPYRRRPAAPPPNTQDPSHHQHVKDCGDLRPGLRRRVTGGRGRTGSHGAHALAALRESRLLVDSNPCARGQMPYMPRIRTPFGGIRVRGCRVAIIGEDAPMAEGSRAVGVNVKSWGSRVPAVE
jgi:hypothetical protein